MSKETNVIHTVEEGEGQSEQKFPVTSLISSAELCAGEKEKLETGLPCSLHGAGLLLRTAFSTSFFSFALSLVSPFRAEPAFAPLDL